MVAAGVVSEIAKEMGGDSTSLKPNGGGLEWGQFRWDKFVEEAGNSLMRNAVSTAVSAVIDPDHTQLSLSNFLIDSFGNALASGIVRQRATPKGEILPDDSNQAGSSKGNDTASVNMAMMDKQMQESTDALADRLTSGSAERMMASLPEFEVDTGPRFDARGLGKLNKMQQESVARMMENLPEFEIMDSITLVQTQSFIDQLRSGASQHYSTQDTLHYDPDAVSNGSQCLIPGTDEWRNFASVKQKLEYVKTHPEKYKFEVYPRGDDSGFEQALERSEAISQGPMGATLYLAAKGLDMTEEKQLTYLQLGNIGDGLLVSTGSTRGKVPEVLNAKTMEDIKIVNSVATKRANQLDVDISERHLLGSLSIPKQTGNSLFLGSREEAMADLAEIRSGVATRNGEYFTTSSERVWGLHNSSAHPVSGPNVVNVSSQEYNILVQAQKQGFDKATLTLDKMSQKGLLTTEQVNRTQTILAIMRSRKGG